MDAATEKVLTLNIENLSQSDLDYIHELRRVAMNLQGWLQIKHKGEL